MGVVPLAFLLLLTGSVMAAVPYGKYFIEVTANPKNRLSEGDQTNNVSYRPVWIGGTPGERTVRVKPLGLVDVR